MAALLSMSFVLGGLAGCGGAPDVSIVFNVNGDVSKIVNQPDGVTVKKGATVSKPAPDPEWGGKVFLGWYTSKTGDTLFDFSRPLTEEVTVVYARWEDYAERYEVLFDFQGKGANVAATVVEGDPVAPPEVAEPADFLFDGWFLEPSCVTPFSASAPVSSAFTVYAKWAAAVNLTFDLNYSGAIGFTQKARAGFSPDRPTHPARDGWAFAGWFADSGAAVPYTFGPISAAATVYAKWVDAAGAKHTVTFRANYAGGPPDAARRVVQGAVVDPPAWARDGYRLAGWYTDAALTVPFALETPVAGALDLYASWVQGYSVAIDYNYENAPAPTVIAVEYGSVLAEPAAPSRIGYTFAGWSGSPAGSVGYAFGGTVAGNVTLYAQWSKVWVYEAEDVDFSGFRGMGFSGNAQGTDAIVPDASGDAGASNGHYVTYLYAKSDATKLTFNFRSDRALSGVKLTLRLTAEIKDIVLKSSGGAADPVYTVKVNGQAVPYSEIWLSGVPSQGLGLVRPFEDVLLGSIDLLEGDNAIELITDNEIGMGGTMAATAPMVDCIKIDTYAVLTWTRFVNY
jgi:uncharacterized repeat protein (TIGR02543 family)